MHQSALKAFTSGRVNELAGALDVLRAREFEGATLAVPPGSAPLGVSEREPIAVSPDRCRSALAKATDPYFEDANIDSDLGRDGGALRVMLSLSVQLRSGVRPPLCGVYCDE